MSDEEWRPVPDWPGYQVSSVGRVLSLKRGEPLLMTMYLVRGYRRVSLSKPGGRRLAGVHSLVAAAFIGPRPDGLEIRHLNGDPLDNVVTNLTYGTRSENMQDRLRHGRHPMANRTHCKRGHEFTPENTHVYRGSRFCRACRRSRRLEAARAA